MKTAQGTRAEPAENCQNPGDFGTNGTRGVVLSGMSETTKRTLGADMIDLSVPWAKRIDPTHLAARPVDQHALRASTLGAEGGVGDFTPNRSGAPGTASEAQTSRENSEGCRVLKWPVLTVAFIVLNLASLGMLVSSLGPLIGALAWVSCLLVGCMLAEFWIVRPRAARRRASGGGIR